MCLLSTEQKSGFLEKVQVRGSGEVPEVRAGREGGGGGCGVPAVEPAGRRREGARGSEMQCVNNRWCDRS